MSIPGLQIFIVSEKLHFGPKACTTATARTTLRILLLFRSIQCVCWY